MALATALSGLRTPAPLHTHGPCLGPGQRHLCPASSLVSLLPVLLSSSPTSTLTSSVFLNQGLSLSVASCAQNCPRFPRPGESGLCQQHSVTAPAGLFLPWSRFLSRHPVPSPGAPAVPSGWTVSEGFRDRGTSTAGELECGSPNTIRPLVNDRALELVH